jgi:Outer membrane protein beta-barrel domain
MKRMILVFLAVGSAVIASAQIQFGIKAGYNLSNFKLSGNIPSELSPNSKSNFSAGALVSIHLLNSFYLQPEAMYSGQGASFNEDGQVLKLNYSYLNVPVLFKYQHASGLFAETGPQVGFLLSANSVAPDGSSQDNKGDSQSTDFSWDFGIGYKIPIINLGADLRYNLGLTNVNKDASNGTVKNSVYQVGLFYMF